jgi:hypothetical protein
MAEREEFESGKLIRSFNNIENAAGTLKAMEDSVSSANGSQTDHGSAII